MLDVETYQESVKRVSVGEISVTYRLLLASPCLKGLKCSLCFAAQAAKQALKPR